MDILTPRGQKTLFEEEEAVSLFTKKFPKLTYIHTPKDSPCSIDAIIAEAGVIKYVVECKCRQSTVNEFFGRFSGEWLITQRKIERAIGMASELYVPLLGFLYLVPSNTLLVQKIWAPKGGLQCKVSEKVTETQATVNGGSAIRLNSFIDMSNATMIEKEKSAA